MLNFWPKEKQIAYYPDYFRALTKAAVLNNAVITQTGDFSSVAIWVPPGSTIDNWRTHIPAGLFKVIWDVGLQGCYVSSIDLWITTDSHSECCLILLDHLRL